MSGKLKLYTGCVTVAGFLVLGAALWNGEVTDPTRFLVYLALAVVASTLKVRLPGIAGTYSLNFLFVLVGVLHFSPAETLVVGIAGGMVQAFWNAKRPPRPVQVLFNVGNLSLSIGLCHFLAHGPLLETLSNSTLAVVVCLFFVVNTGLVYGVLSRPEISVLAATAALVQCLWKQLRRPQPERVAFSVAAMALSAGLAHTLCRLWLPSGVAESVLPSLVLATACLYLCNTLLVALAWCLTEARPLRDVWCQCSFWCFPYYMVGAGFAALMIQTSQTTGWRQSFLLLPLMLLVYVSHRLHVDGAGEPALSSTEAHSTT